MDREQFDMIVKALQALDDIDYRKRSGKSVGCPHCMNGDLILNKDKKRWECSACERWFSENFDFSRYMISRVRRAGR